MKPVDHVISKVASPVLKEAGFKRSGRWFHRPTSSGDLASVWFQSWPLGQADAELMVNRSLFVRAYHDKVGWPWPDPPKGAVSAGTAFWWRRIRDPQGSGPGDELWQLDLDDDEGLDRFAKVLAEGIADFNALAERENLIAWLRSLDPESYDGGLAFGPIRRVLDLLEHGSISPDHE